VIPRASLLGVAAVALRRAQYWQGDVDHEHESTLCLSRDKVVVDLGVEEEVEEEGEEDSDLSELDAPDEENEEKDDGVPR